MTTYYLCRKCETRKAEHDKKQKDEFIEKHGYPPQPFSEHRSGQMITVVRE